MNRSLQLLVLIVGVVVVLGCTTPDAMTKRNPLDVINPKMAPVENVTDFNQVMRCIGKLVAVYGNKAFVVGNDYIRNESGEKEVPLSGRTMLQSAFASLVEHGNGKIVWSGWDEIDAQSYKKSLATQVVDVNIKSNKPVRNTNSDFLIKGAITQFERSPIRMSRDIDVRVSDAGSIGYSDGSRLSVIAVSLTLHDARDRNLSIYKGIHSDNIMSIRSQDESLGFLAGVVRVGGFGYNVSLVQSEGVSAALLSLMQLGASEIVGKFYKEDFDYGVCMRTETREEAMQSLKSQNDAIVNRNTKQNDGSVLRSQSSGTSEGNHMTSTQFGDTDMVLPLELKRFLEF